ncbi:MAG: PaaI family thioesterase [Sphingomonadaceae bacterium]|nr:PaaI family thioesterase [Sphingomonadaceae bacterium]MCP5383265.1 PaaI family thioesterase [Altererythrobacter sp.]MCP5393442.1 PaaI family thioesterase [Sphingomonadaceae bacterium]
MTSMFDRANVWPHAKLLGAQAVDFDEATQTITMRFAAPPEFITPRGSVQGGLVAGFLDEAMGWAYTRATGGTHSPLMLDLNISLLKPVPEGPLLAKGRVVRAGRRVLFLEAELMLEDGTVLARSTSTAIPTENPGASAR